MLVPYNKMLLYFSYKIEIQGLYSTAKHNYICSGTHTRTRVCRGGPIDTTKERCSCHFIKETPDY